MTDTYVNALSPQWTYADETGKVTATTVWQVEAIGEPISLPGALNAVDIDTNQALPIKGESFPETTGVPCVKRSPKYADQSRMLVIVTCEYDSTKTVATSPLSAAPKISSTGETLEESYYEDKTTPTPKLARHTNGRPFDELPKRDTSIRVYTIVRNVAASTTDATVAALENKINSGSVTILGLTWPAKTLKVGVCSLSEQKTENGVNYKELTATVRGNPAGWSQKYESLGLVDINGNPIADAGGNPTEQPWPLTSAGMGAATPATKGAEITLEPYTAVSSFSPLL